MYMMLLFFIIVMFIFRCITLKIFFDWFIWWKTKRKICSMDHWNKNELSSIPRCCRPNRSIWFIDLSSQSVFDVLRSILIFPINNRFNRSSKTYHWNLNHDMDFVDRRFVDFEMIFDHQFPNQCELLYRQKEKISIEKRMMSPGLKIFTLDVKNFPNQDYRLLLFVV